MEKLFGFSRNDNDVQLLKKIGLRLVPWQCARKALLHLPHNRPVRTQGKQPSKVSPSSINAMGKRSELGHKRILAKKRVNYSVRAGKAPDPSDIEFLASTDNMAVGRPPKKHPSQSVDEGERPVKSATAHKSNRPIRP